MSSPSLKAPLTFRWLFSRLWVIVNLIDRALTLEDVHEHMPEILDDRQTNVWNSVDEALQNRLKKLQLAGVDPMDTVYPD